jgi:hypothetical protein
VAAFHEISISWRAGQADPASIAQTGQRLEQVRLGQGVEVAQLGRRLAEQVALDIVAAALAAEVEGRLAVYRLGNGLDT